MMFVVRGDIHSSGGNLKKVKQESMDLARHLTAEGISRSHLSPKTWNNSFAFFKDGA
jgi:hypothetical protein